MPTKKILGQAAPTSGTPTPNLVSGLGAPAIVSSITVANWSTSATDYFTIRAIQGGASADNKQYVAYRISIAPQSMRRLTIGLTLDTNDSIQVTSDNKTCAFNAFGVID